MICNLCPRNCNALRTDTKGGGLCGMPALPVAARAALHQWEEPPISGTRGSGTIFFSGCPLQCVFCQNEPISHQGRGKAITPEHLRALCFQLIDQGAHNINFVTPTHYTHVLLDVLREPLPVHRAAPREARAHRAIPHWQALLPPGRAKRANTPTSCSASRRHLTIRGPLLESRRARARRCSSATPGLRKKAGKT